MQQIFLYLLARLKEPSSYASLAILLGTVATQLTAYPKIAGLFLAGSAIAGAFGFALKEKSGA